MGLPRWMHCFALAAPLFLSGCNNAESTAFQEDVVLNNGQAVIVRRALFRNNVWPRLSDEGYQAVMDDWVSVPIFHTVWQSKRDGRGGRPLSLGMVNGELFIATETRHDLCFCVDHPSALNTRVFKSSGGAWEEVEVSDALLDGLTQNIPRIQWHASTRPGDASTTDNRGFGAPQPGSEPSLRSFLNRTAGGSCVASLMMSNWLSRDYTGAASVAESGASIDRYLSVPETARRGCGGPPQPRT